LHETDILRKLAHQNIITIFEVFEDEAQFYLVTELCTMGDLYDAID
jgi:serine/threonine protein kinase